MNYLINFVLNYLNFRMIRIQEIDDKKSMNVW